MPRYNVAPKAYPVNISSLDLVGGPATVEVVPDAHMSITEVAGRAIKSTIAFGHGHSDVAASPFYDDPKIKDIKALRVIKDPIVESTYVTHERQPKQRRQVRKAREQNKYRI